MAVKYRIQYTSVDGVDYTCDISNPSYAGSVIELDGSVEYGLNPVETLDHPIRSKYLRITVTATTSQDLEDLLTSGERYWRVEFYRDVNKIFFGYLTSDKSPQSFVQDSWDLTLDALDPLAFLEDLAYVDNLGANFNGYDQFAYIIANCLKRGFESTSEEFNILAYVPYDYRVRTATATYTEYTSGRLLKLCGINQDDFIDTDTDEVLSCKEVLEKVLSSLQLTITQINGDTWLLMHYYRFVSDLSSTYIEYFDSDGDDLAGTPPDPFDQTLIYTDVGTRAQTDVVHANENQQYYFNYPLGKFVSNFEYKYKNSLLDNPDMDGGTTGISMPGWGFGDFGYPVNDGTFLVYRQDDAVNLDETAILSDTDLYVESGQRFTLNIVCQTNYNNAQFRFRVEYETLGGTTYYLGYRYINIGSNQTQLAWGTSVKWITEIFEDENGDKLTNTDFTFSYEIPEIPTDSGTLKIRVLSLYAKDTSNTTDYVTVQSIDFSGSTQAVTGRSTVGLRTDIGVFKSEKFDQYINTGSNNAAHNTMVYLASSRPIFQVRDVVFDASNWRTLGYVITRNRIDCNQLKKFFTGDFWNFFEPHQTITIGDLSGAWRAIEYSFDTKNNIGSYRLEENNEAGTAPTVTTSNVYQNTIKPTIK